MATDAARSEVFRCLAIDREAVELAGEALIGEVASLFGHSAPVEPLGRRDPHVRARCVHVLALGQDRHCVRCIETVGCVERENRQRTEASEFAWSVNLLAARQLPGGGLAVAGEGVIGQPVGDLGVEDDLSIEFGRTLFAVASLWEHEAQVMLIGLECQADLSVDESGAQVATLDVEGAGLSGIVEVAHVEFDHLNGGPEERFVLEECVICEFAFGVLIERSLGEEGLAVGSAEQIHPVAEDQHLLDLVVDEGRASGGWVVGVSFDDGEGAVGEREDAFAIGLDEVGFVYASFLVVGAREVFSLDEVSLAAHPLGRG